jgi:predicted solute-binding protein
MTNTKKRLALTKSFEINPLIKGLEDKFEIVYMSPAECSNFLATDKVDVALIPPIEYARKVHDKNYFIIPEICVTSHTEAKNAIILLSPNLENIETVGFRLGIVSEVVLSKILFLENYDIELKFLPLTDDVDGMLSKADAVILSGDLAFQNYSKYESKLYFSEEWFEITELPFVSALWVTKEEKLSAEEIEFLKETVQKNIVELLSQIDAYDEEHGMDAEGNKLYYGCKYIIGEEEINSLNLFFEYAFSYGMLEDIPELKFL